MKKVFALTLFLFSFIFSNGQESVDFNVEGYYSFEEAPAPACAPSKKSRLEISSERFKTGSSSLKWAWKRDGSSFLLNAPVPYLKKNPNPKETSVSTFVFWVYSPEKLGGDLVFSFLKKGRVCSSFRYKLGFKGWRGAWVAFDRDMEGKPEEGMDAVEIRVEGVKKGELYFDGVIPAAFEDVRYHTPDFQAPFINKGTSVHWLLLNEHWKKSLCFNPQDKAYMDSEAEMELLRERFVEIVASGVKTRGFDVLKKAYSSYGIRSNSDGTITGKPVFFTRYGETFINLGVADASSKFAAAGELLRPYNDLMFEIAKAWLACKDASQKIELASMYVNMTRHLLDQGFAAGSGMGTLHHLGYSMRNFYNGPVIMKDVLREAGLLEEVQQAMEWFSGAGEVKLPPQEPGVDIDAFNTYLMSRAASLIMMENSQYKYAYLKALSSWLDNGFLHVSGTKPSFKPDGTVFHHRKAYPAYATGGFDGAVKAVWLLRGTSFAVSEKSHGNLKRALMEMRFYCNLRSFPLAMSGRHPDGKGGLIPEQYALLADAGSPDGKEKVDKELAAAYLRLGPEKGRWVTKFSAAGIEPEKSPVGAKVYSYNSSLSYRGGDWLVTIAGHSRYLWATETYVGANHYGRYLAHGSMEIIGDSSGEGGDGKTISSLGSGYQVEGYDWCHIPGTTAAAIPLKDMKSEVLNVDEFSGYEEMLLSDEWFAGGLAHRLEASSDKGRYGSYAMILHEHDKYNGSLRARKSFFLFGNRVICLGSGLENTLPSSELHTTLFQNTINPGAPSFLNGEFFKSEDIKKEAELPMNVAGDRFGNLWFVKDAKVVLSRARQSSFHEETDKPTQGLFEKAYIHHWAVDGNGAKEAPAKDGYEYMVVIKPSENEAGKYSSQLPYRVLSRTNKLHAVADSESGTVGAAVFETSPVDGLVLEASPCMLMYSIDDKGILLSVSNPDLALYEGEADEVYENGKRKERSVYSRAWIDNDCGQTEAALTLAGKWKLSGEGSSDVSVSYREDRTFLVFRTSQAKTEEIRLKSEI